MFIWKTAKRPISNIVRKTIRGFSCLKLVKEAMIKQWPTPIVKAAQFRHHAKGDLASNKPIITRVWLGAYNFCYFFSFKKKILSNRKEEEM